jgi:glucose/arabinose dehydrogenase
MRKFSFNLVYLVFFSSILIAIVVFTQLSTYSNAEGTTNACADQCRIPTLSDSDLKIEMVYQGNFKFQPNDLALISSMTFLGPQDIILLDKNNGTVYRILNNTLSEKPLLDVSVANERERGLLGVETSQSENNTRYLYLYYTESKRGDGIDICPNDPKQWYSQVYHCKPENEPIGNRLYKYELRDNELINPKILLELPAWPSASHNGGALNIGPDNNLYLTIGDLLGGSSANSRTRAQNFNSTEPDGRAGILRVTQDGNAVGEGILGKSMPLSLYYAYGIRNSFGIDFDPITGNLWDTENGPAYADEVNLVRPGFNSGWEGVQGIWEPIVNQSGDGGSIAGNELLNPNDKLVNFDGKGVYSEPEFIWKSTVAPTAIKFLDSDKLGQKYENDLFIASSNLGTIFHFDLNRDRTGLKLNGSLANKIADSKEDLHDMIFAQGIGVITDMDIGPDGYVYVLSLYGDRPTIFRISPLNI